MGWECVLCCGLGSVQNSRQPQASSLYIGMLYDLEGILQWVKISPSVAETLLFDAVSLEDAAKVARLSKCDAFWRWSPWCITKHTIWGIIRIYWQKIKWVGSIRWSMSQNGSLWGTWSITKLEAEKVIMFNLKINARIYQFPHLGVKFRCKNVFFLCKKILLTTAVGGYA